MAQKVEDFTKVRSQFDSDRYRPSYHFLPPANWVNDPNGPIYWNGEYHIFYQYNPDGAFHANMHWGHAVSADLVYWTDLPIALSPDPDGPDKDGVYTGSAFDNNGVPTILYTGVRPEVQCLATGDKDLRIITKHPENPVISVPPEGIEITGFRDPAVWKGGGYWYMALGSGIADVGGMIMLYRSADLVNWDYIHLLLSGVKEDTGMNWECPDFFPLGDKHVLIISPQTAPRTPGGTLYFIGDYDGNVFVPEKSGLFDSGTIYYAPKSFVGKDGRRIVWGWLREGRSVEAHREAGWAGALTLRELSLGEDGGLNITPVPELHVLRNRLLHVANASINPGSGNPLERATGDCLEINIEIERINADFVELRLRRSPNRSESTSIRYDWVRRELTLDTTSSSLDKESGVRRETVTAGKSAVFNVTTEPFSVADDETLKLHVFLDRSIIEVFANDRECMTSRIYPTRPDSLGVELVVNGGSVKIVEADVWEMASIW